MATFGDAESIGVIRDFGQPRTWYNSSVLKFNNAITGRIWELFNKNRSKWLKYQGDQNVVTLMLSLIHI